MLKEANRQIKMKPGQNRGSYKQPIRLKDSIEQRINSFKRLYIDPGYKLYRNHIILSGANSPEHNQRVALICCHLLEMNIPFYTEVRLKCGLRVDICTPTHVKPFIEVCHLETPQSFLANKEYKIPHELKNEFIFNYTAVKFNRIHIL